MTHKPGDQVKIITKDEEFVGILMPRPELLDKEETIIKLESGYNMGIDNKKIKETQLIKHYTSPKELKKEIKQKKGLPNISLFAKGSMENPSGE